MKLSINFGFGALASDVIKYSESKIIHTGVVSAFKKLGDTIASEIEVVSVRPENCFDDVEKNFVILKVVLRDLTKMKDDINGRFCCENLEKPYNVHDVEKKVVDMTFSLFERKYERIIKEHTRLNSIVGSLSKLGLE